MTRAVALRPNSEAIVDGETRLTYAQWGRRVRGVTAGLRDPRPAHGRRGRRHRPEQLQAPGVLGWHSCSRHGAERSQLSARCPRAGIHRQRLRGPSPRRRWRVPGGGPPVEATLPLAANTWSTSGRSSTPEGWVSWDDLCAANSPRRGSPRASCDRRGDAGSHLLHGRHDGPAQRCDAEPRQPAGQCKAHAHCQSAAADRSLHPRRPDVPRRRRCDDVRADFHGRCPCLHPRLRAGVVRQDRRSRESHRGADRPDDDQHAAQSPGHAQPRPLFMALADVRSVADAGRAAAQGLQHVAVRLRPALRDDGGGAAGDVHAAHRQSRGRPRDRAGEEPLGQLWATGRRSRGRGPPSGRRGLQGA